MNIRSPLLVVSLLLIVGALTAWKTASIAASEAAAANQAEPVESVVVATARAREHQPSITAVGTVVALRSVTLRNEVPGTVQRVNLTPGRIVEAGTVLVALDVSVEEAELRARRARAALARTLFEREARLNERGAASATELDTARAERDVALAEVARVEAIIARKTIRAPFRARIGISDVHRGQYLDQGTELTTLQGIDANAYVDFSVAQDVAAKLRRRAGDATGPLEILSDGAAAPLAGTLVATDARIDPDTRNAIVRVRIDAANAPAPGAAVRVQVPDGPAQTAMAVPVGALRKGPTGDHVFVIGAGEDGELRASARPVAVGAVLGSEVLIRSGVKAGERIAASGSFKLRDSTRVAIADDADVSPARLAAASEVR